jgi:hypothetical protein
MPTEIEIRVINLLSATDYAPGTDPDDSVTVPNTRKSLNAWTLPLSAPS